MKIVKVEYERVLPETVTIELTGTETATFVAGVKTTGYFESDWMFAEIARKLDAELNKR